MSKNRQIFREMLNFGRKQPPPDAVAPSLIALQQQVERLTEQNTKLAEEKATLEADKIKWIGHITLLEQEGKERFEFITELRKDVSAGIERITELEHDAMEHAVASARYVKDIADLQGNCMHLAAEKSQLEQENGKLKKEAKEWSEEGNRYLTDLLLFVRRVSAGTNIRIDKPHGKALVDDAKELLKQYESIE